MISYGKGPLGRIYEKLRKRDYRRMKRVLRNPNAVKLFNAELHAEYTRGVREGLAEVAAPLPYQNHARA